MSILVIEELSHFFGGLKAINNFQMVVEEGKIYGVIGPNGAGKTTLFNLITGAFTPSEGKIFYNDVNIAGMKSYQIARMGMARTFQNLRLFGDLTVGENIRVGRLHHHKGRKSGENRFGQDEDAVIQNLLNIAGLSCRADEKASSLPYGLQRKLEIVRAVATEPEILLLDEPAAGMNPNEVMTLVDLIQDVKKQFGLTIILIEHQMKLVDALCDYITVMNFGGVIARGTPSEVKENPVVITAYLGLGEVG
ncbi:MAG TPA: ABC transporter ATP-binding protein [Negativicutes bacterium]|jgi:branched-chain amino acid transport system ATP-binding protein